MKSWICFTLNPYWSHKAWKLLPLLPDERFLSLLLNRIRWHSNFSDNLLVAQPEEPQGTKACFSPSSSNFLGIYNFPPRNTNVLTLISISFFRRATLDLQWCIHGFLTYYISHTSELCWGDGIQTCMTTCQHKLLTILISKSPIYLLVFYLSYFFKFFF